MKPNRRKKRNVKRKRSEVKRVKCPISPQKKIVSIDATKLKSNEILVVVVVVRRKVKGQPEVKVVAEMSSSVVSSSRGGSRVSEPARPIYLMERCLAVRFERLSSKMDAIDAIDAAAAAAASSTSASKTPTALQRINRNKVPIIMKFNQLKLN